ncbi:LysR family transcriptional regulator [Shewanella sp. SR44-3]|uniref:LysR family transcriptional regulator n=1 Tax=Shewanella sp. SR44-3 TaxID=2760936 RepID=UPI0015FDD40B|nr:LysR family transcriptional regulator [Shewanella sp. SR44-3]MBB1270834.1 LysR family transcriptional regulator [Shewanella sp. SR44-3]
MNTQDLTLFVHTADNGSITGAAHALDMSTAAASAALKRLEKQLNTSLFIRSTRQLRLTTEGEHFLLHCRQALDTLAAGQASMEALQGRVAGEVRISAPSDLGRNLLLPWMDEIMDLHPELKLHLIIGDSLADFYHDRIDLALRYGQPNDSAMVAFKLANVERIICASPSYLARFGMPVTPQDLTEHNCLLYQLNDRSFDLWEFEAKLQTDAPTDQPRESYKVRVKSNRCCNDGDLVRRWALAGKGIANKSRLDVNHDLAAGRLVRLLPDYHSPEKELNLLCPSRKQVTPTVLLLRDMLRDKFKQMLG